jgi:hypothetical protein
VIISHTFKFFNEIDATLKNYLGFSSMASQSPIKKIKKAIIAVPSKRIFTVIRML